MLPWLSGAADPGRVHTEGRIARAAVETAREQVAALVGCRPREVVFTSGATESVTAAVWGATERGSHIVSSPVEHSAVREASARWEVTEVGVDHLGRVDPTEVAAAVRPGATALVHIQLGNHEVATMQPAADVVVECHASGVLVHVDGAAAVGHVPVDFGVLGADLLSVSAHKFGGPQGTGALIVRRGLRLRPLFVGGAQERSRRAGMENVAGIVGFGAAAAAVDVARESGRARTQTDRALAGALAVEGVVAYGDVEHRLPHIICIGVGGVEAEAVLLGLDQAGVAA
ncbi:MAG: aminotransferase class V-fold PLP-dependent enzyme, partial [Actinomycetota bacterium]|nr:aminotransferase class V-fold PLP-dependent enzyme [Actinomycetota bacterium]